jgi:predicted DNA-binding WGR domain protein
MEQCTSNHFIRCDPKRNMNRFYRLTVTRDLLGKTLLIREWGRVGVYARCRSDEKPGPAEAVRDAAALAAQKMHRGYVPVID